jgi:hypothetical protein
MLGHPFLERLDAALVDAVPSMSIAVHGEWAVRTRPSNRGEIVDHVWEGRLTAASAFTGMAFRQIGSGMYWVKTSLASRELGASVSFHRYADDSSAEQMFAAGIEGANLPSAPVATNFRHPSECLVDTTTFCAGRVVCLARCSGDASFVVLFAIESVTFGRNRLWRVRDSISSQFPPDIAELLTRRRAGVLRPAPDE